MIIVNGDPLAWTEGMTVRDVLKAKNYKFPMLIITIGETKVEPRDYDATPVPDGATVNVLHLLSGG